MILSQAINKSPDYNLYKEDSILLSNSHSVGVEVEIENCVYSFKGSGKEEPQINRFSYDDRIYLPQIHYFWHVIKDGSLRQGTEFTFKGPLAGANITAALSHLDSFFSVYKRNGLFVEASDRTSIHIHLDFRNSDEYLISNFILTYLLLERILFRYTDIIGGNRSKNNYCRPLTDSDFMLFLKDLKYYTINELMGSLLDHVTNTCDKYSALNILPLASYGSMEFRHHQGTSNMKDVLDWINIIFAVRLHSEKYSIEETIDSYRVWGSQVLNNIFKGTKLLSIIKDNRKDFNILLRKGANDIIEVLKYDELSKLVNDSKYKKIKQSKDTLLAKYIKKNNIIIKNEIKYKNSSVDLDYTELFTNLSFSNPAPTSPPNESIDILESEEPVANTYMADEVNSSESIEVLQENSDYFQDEVSVFQEEMTNFINTSIEIIDDQTALS